MIHLALWLASLLFLIWFAKRFVLPVLVFGLFSFHKMAVRFDDALCMGAAYVICSPVLFWRALKTVISSNPR